MRVGSQTFAFSPNSFLKMPIVPGPQTSWVIWMSTSTQTFSPGATSARPAWAAMIFSVIVILRGLGAGNLRDRRLF